jgi:hypothetical protein
MKSVGIEIKSSTCILVVIETAELINESIKIELKDSYEAKSVKNFFSEIKTWLDQVNPDLVNIKKRAEKGKFSGGASSFKIEGLIQLAASGPVKLVGGPELNRLSKSIQTFPTMKKYQEQAYLAALSSL